MTPSINAGAVTLLELNGGIKIQYVCFYRTVTSLLVLTPGILPPGAGEPKFDPVQNALLLWRDRRLEALRLTQQMGVTRFTCFRLRIYDLNKEQS